VERKAGTRPTRRERLAWPADRKFKILSLDGGGMRGLFTAALLSDVEDRIVGKGEIANHVDMIAGTSTGGIIALALGLQVPARRIETLYLDEGRKIFPPWRRNLGPLSVLWQMFRPLHNHAALERSLYDVFGDAVMGASTTRLVIPAFLVPRAEITVF